MSERDKYVHWGNATNPPLDKETKKINMYVCSNVGGVEQELFITRPKLIYAHQIINICNPIHPRYSSHHPGQCTFNCQLCSTPIRKTKKLLNILNYPILVPFIRILRITIFFFFNKYQQVMCKNCYLLHFFVCYEL